MRQAWSWMPDQVRHDDWMELLPRQLGVQRLDHRILRRREIGEPVPERINVGQAVDLLVDAAFEIEAVDVGERGGERRAGRAQPRDRLLRDDPALAGNG